MNGFEDGGPGEPEMADVPAAPDVDQLTLRGAPNPLAAEEGPKPPNSELGDDMVGENLARVGDKCNLAGSDLEATGFVSLSAGALGFSRPRCKNELEAGAAAPGIHE